ncbi:MAG: DUF481 domain-containing protein [Acidobacteriota bacterium]|nr:MAG: DUF481 domain-containing protein [Acidobacteriota bacterium]
MKRRISPLVAALLLLAAPAAPLLAEEGEPERPWSDTAEFSFINTTGNSESTNVAFSNKFIYNWTDSDLTVTALALRTESSTFARRREGDVVVVDKTSQVTTETYALDGKYRRNISDRFLWYVGAGWNKNEPAGINSRYYVSPGIGYRFFEDDKHSLVGEFGVTYTDETYVKPLAPGQPEGNSYLGARGFLGYHRVLSESATFDTELELLQNLDETDDMRARWLTSVTASVTQKVALKASYMVLYDAEPVLINVEGLPFELDDTDTILSASVVVNF